MAKIIKTNYDYDFIDEDGPYIKSIDLEENGVIYNYDRKKCCVSKIKEGVENVIIADEVNNGSIKYTVTRWGIPLCYKECLNNVKSIELGKNLTEFNDLTTSGLENLEKLIIPESFNKFPPFYNCKKLKEINMPDRIPFDLEQMAWRFPNLNNLVLLHDGCRREIGENELSAKRLLYQKKLDKEEQERIAEEKRIEKEEKKKERIERYTDYYIQIACILPYIWVLSNIVRNKIDFDLGWFRVIIGTILIIIVGGIVLLFPAAIAYGIALEIRNHSDRKIITSLLAPFITVPLSWIIFCIAIWILSLWVSCSSGFYGILDPRFL